MSESWDWVIERQERQFLERKSCYHGIADLLRERPIKEVVDDIDNGKF